ncbi:PREDICTED: guanine nucleotide-binding protein-like 1 isoform X1 [Amphimedon queenslandica]|uniref:Guanine nucleotide-binding protein-like 1 n=1 Tax=Amphimedon queenslandica TaxID=400682 RepID=A0A1X7VBC7_AMPQE|nr:PREDICTED: guanine nucleotide-binding protein-like 1 isoform X1 [Amphimedon queenslandica]|eukprot:XP_019849904.1 PREDICTED: guanine nucleotide-binding protein-like 1 isoform X1 [Amphimedon queenslandica]
MPRRKPFSSKQKKEQLQRKRQKKRSQGQNEGQSLSAVVPDQVDEEQVSSSESDSETEEAVEKQSELPRVVSKLGHQPAQLHGKYDPNRFRLHFNAESQEEIDKRKHIAKTRIIVPVEENMLEVSVDDIYQPGSVLDFPKRPPWTYKMSKAEVHRKEEEMFTEYLENIYTKYGDKSLSYFEHNLETWRQLWRVLELSDIILLITDIRHPVLHFSPALYDYVVNDLKKTLVLILNKVDLVPPQVAVAWRHYFLHQFPHLHVVCFTCYPNSDVSTEVSQKVKLKSRRRRGKRLSAVGPKELFEVIERIYKGKINLSHETELQSSKEFLLPEIDKELVESDNVYTIGLVGHPNVGKSSILNGLIGKKSVSTSKTPGHTKHLQTIFLTPTVRLCDCPGLVFPSLIEKQLQILSGIYPIAQVKEPYTSIGYLAERVPLVELLQLSHPEEEKMEEGDTVGGAIATVSSESSLNWTAWNICDAWAEKKQYFTARAARLDTYRAANHLLRLASDGRVCMFFMPPGYLAEKEGWEKNPEVERMILLQKQGMSTSDSGTLLSLTSESSDEESNSPPTVHSNKFTALLDIEESD